MRKLLLFCSLLLLIVAKGYSQSRTVTGTVTDKGNQPLPGVSVIVVDTKIGTVTNLKGKFSISAQNGQTLKLTFLGLKTINIPVTSSTSNLSIQMEDESNSLNEVVVT